MPKRDDERLTRNAKPMKPRYRSCFAVDISRFASRDPASQALARQAVHTITRDASSAADLAWRSEVSSDRGDGVLVVTKKVRPEVLFGKFIRGLGIGVREHNMACPPPVKMQLRAALDAGFILEDARGHSGTPLNRVSRMIDAPEFKERMNEAEAEFGVIMSGHLYEVACDYRLLDGTRLEKIRIDVKETHTDAWMWIP